MEVSSLPAATAPATDALAKALQDARLEAYRRRASAQPTPLPTVEGTDTRLRDALQALAGSTSARSHVLVAQEYHRVRVFDRALEHYDLALEREPRSAAAWDGRARTWRDMGLLAVALGDALRARFHAPKDPSVRNTLATIHEALGQRALAEQEFEAAVALDPGAEYAAGNLRRLKRTAHEATEAIP